MIETAVQCQKNFEYKLRVKQSMSIFMKQTIGRLIGDLVRCGFLLLKFCQDVVLVCN